MRGAAHPPEGTAGRGWAGGIIGPRDLLRGGVGVVETRVGMCKGVPTTLFQWLYSPLLGLIT